MWKSPGVRVEAGGGRAEQVFGAHDLKIGCARNGGERLAARRRLQATSSAWCGHVDARPGPASTHGCGRASDLPSSLTKIVVMRRRMVVTPSGMTKAGELTAQPVSPILHTPRPYRDRCRAFQAKGRPHRLLPGKPLAAPSCRRRARASSFETDLRKARLVVGGVPLVEPEKRFASHPRLAHGCSRPVSGDEAEARGKARRQPTRRRPTRGDDRGDDDGMKRLHLQRDRGDGPAACRRPSPGRCRANWPTNSVQPMAMSVASSGSRTGVQDLPAALGSARGYELARCVRGSRQTAVGPDEVTSLTMLMASWPARR